jgi:hypothetical protein
VEVAIAIYHPERQDIRCGLSSRLLSASTTMEPLLLLPTAKEVV